MVAPRFFKSFVGKTFKKGGIMENIIIKALKKKKDFVSGEELSREIGVSRTSIWKHINELRKNGYEIESKSKVGYKLVKTTENIDKAVIYEELDTDFIGREILVFESIDSTNSEAKRRVISNFSNGLTFISEEQTAGRGRLGRDWISPKGKGLWMSIVFKPKALEPKDGSKITLVAAAAVAKAIEKTTNLHVGIKWPNDIVCNGKKVCGILTEMGADPDFINWMVVGIGINVNLEKKDFPAELEKVGTSLKIEMMETEKAIDRNILAAAILNELEELSVDFLETGSLSAILGYYREKVIIKGKELLLHKRDEIVNCTGVDISDEGHLIVEMENGVRQEFLSGEVSVRGLYGYV